MNDAENRAEFSVAGSTAHLPRWVPGVAVLLAAALAWMWIDTRGDVQALRGELAGKLRETDSDSRDARAAARQAQESVRDAQVRIVQLESRLAESQNQQLALESLYQDLSRGRDEWVLAEVEQILAIASQQLQLAGNVQAALVALQTADARLAGSERPQLISVRKALAQDIERLKSAPNVDVVGLALKIDYVIAAIEGLPLSADERAVAPRDSEPLEQGFWARLGTGIWDELRQLVRVRNIEQAEAPLLSPTQSYFLKHNLQLRLLNARLALLNRNEPVLRADLAAANAWLTRYFDMRSKSVIAAGATLKQVSASAISIEPPSVAESLAAVHSFKTARDKSTR